MKVSIYVCGGLHESELVTFLAWARGLIIQDKYLYKPMCILLTKGRQPFLYYNL